MLAFDNHISSIKYPVQTNNLTIKCSCDFKVLLIRGLAVWNIILKKLLFYLNFLKSGFTVCA